MRPPEEEQNFATLLEFLNIMEVREDDEEFQNPVDLMFEDLAKRSPTTLRCGNIVFTSWRRARPQSRFWISCGARLAPFDIAELREITTYDELELDTLGDRKTALFLIMSDTDSTFNFLISMVYTQLFNLLCEKADDVYGGRLPVHVRCLIDECANIGQIPNLEKLVATIRSREISACLVLQAQSQLKALYKDNADTSSGTWTAKYSSAARKTPPSKNCQRLWAVKPSTSTTLRTHAATARPLAPRTKRPVTSS